MSPVQRKGISLLAGGRKGRTLSGFEGLDGTSFCSLLNLGQLEQHLAYI